MYQLANNNSTDILDQTDECDDTIDKVSCIIAKIPPTVSEHSYQFSQVNLFFDRIFIINLDRSKDRWRLIVNNLIDNGVYNFERQPGVYLPRKINPKLHLDIRTHGRLEGYGGKFLHDPNYILNCVGTNLAHYQILQKAIHRKYQRILVLEDDVFLARNFNKRFSQIGRFLYHQNNPWDLLYLGHKKSRPQFSPVPVPNTNGNLVIPRQFIRGAFGYGLNKSVFELLQRHYLYDGMEIDAFFEFFMCKYRKVLAVMPPLIGHRDNRVSTITQSKWKGRRDF
jgi:hypothetical protein